MKNLTFLRNFWRRVSAKVHGQDIGLGLRPQCSDVSLDRREHPAARCLQGPRMLTVGSPSGHSTISSGAVAMQVNPRITPMRFACALLVLLTFGIGNAWGADPVATATATSGKSYVIAYWTGSKYVALDPSKIVGKSAGTFAGTDVSVDGNGKVTTANPPLWTLTVNPSQSTQFYISCSANSTTNYLYKNGTSSSTNYNIKTVTSGQHYWTFSKSSNKYSIKSERGSACQYLYYYSSGSKWEVYSTSTASLLLLEPAPAITCATTSLSGFTYQEGSGPSAAQSFSVSGSYLTANITVTAPTNYEVSKSSGSGYASSVTLTQSSGSVSATTVYVRLKSGLSAGTYSSANVTIASTGATSKTIALSGSVTTTSVSLTKAGQTNGSFFGHPFFATQQPVIQVVTMMNFACFCLFILTMSMSASICVIVLIDSTLSFASIGQSNDLNPIALHIEMTDMRFACKTHLHKKCCV